jgi:hypothetical protein
MPGHNASLAILGVFILWFGWYGFNPGSALAILGYGPVASLCAVTTTLAPAAGTVSALIVLMLMEYKHSGHVVWDLIGASNGTLAGLVGITGGTAVVEVCLSYFSSQSPHCSTLLCCWANAQPGPGNCFSAMLFYMTTSSAQPLDFKSTFPAVASLRRAYHISLPSETAHCVCSHGPL